MGRAREHHELRIREAGDVVRDAAEQPEAYPKAHKARASFVPSRRLRCKVVSLEFPPYYRHV